MRYFQTMKNNHQIHANCASSEFEVYSNDILAPIKLNKFICRIRKTNLKCRLNVVKLLTFD